MSEKYSIKSDTFNQQIQLIFRDLYQERIYTDITLVCDDQIQFKTHRTVLSASSPVFKKIIDNNLGLNPLIYLRGIQSQEIESILEFMYLGETEFSPERMGEVLRVAKDLEVKGIGDITEVKEERIAGQEIPDVEVQDGFKKENDQRSMKVEWRQRQGSEQEIRERVESAQFDKDCHEQIHETEIKDQDDDRISNDEDVPKADDVYFPCNQCDHQASSKGNLAEHIQSVHTTLQKVKYDYDDYRIICNQCHRKFTAIASLRRHVESVHENIKFQCDRCDHKSTSKHHLRSHIQTVHEKIRYPCNQCDHQATQLRYLRQHIKSEHENVRYPCIECDYKATSKDRLHEHIKYKHGGIRYPCSVCKSQFTDKNNLRKHFQLKHAGVGYSCTQCDYLANTYAYLKEHIKEKH